MTCTQALASVIVPVYNIEKYVGECIESLIHQTYEQIEIILVDDGSQDGSGAICDCYARMDERITVIHQENMGLSEARNCGMEHMHGSYVFFVDGDDYVEHRVLETAITALQQDGSDICMFNCRMFTGETSSSGSYEDRCTFTERRIAEPGECLRRLLQHRFNEEVWNCVYTVETACCARFPKGKFAEDVFWKYQVICRAKRISQLPDILYHYRMRDGSLTTRRSPSDDLDALEGSCRRASDVSQWYPELKLLAQSEFHTQCLTTYMLLRQKTRGDERKEALKRMNEYHRAIPLDIVSILREPMISRERKVSLLLAPISLDLACAVKHLGLKWKYRNLGKR